MKKNLLSIAITIAVIGVISTSASAQSRAVFHGLNCKGYLADQSYFEYGGWGTRNTKTTGTSFLILSDCEGAPTE